MSSAAAGNSRPIHPQPHAFAHGVTPLDNRLLRPYPRRTSNTAVAIVADPAIVKRFEELGITAVKMNTPEFSAFVARQVADWQPAIKAADLK